ncbi:MAG: bifunctional DNA-formamidopyrimidine glycosylase/DNA-(apurinic or apyrimidinic site) lyase [Bacillota bacterium]|jgi:formamidopyrimidine-DNA glycosylase
MPELPEVETIRRTLEPLVASKKITKVRVLRDSVIKHPSVHDFCRLLTDRTIKNLARRGKYLLLNLQDGYILAVHLRMTGQLTYALSKEETAKHTHVIFYLSDGNQLRFTDVRRFGCLWLLAPQETDNFTGMARLGKEAWGEEISPDYLKETLAKRKICIKQALLDQSVLAGLGNIYVDEVLFAAAIDPMRKTADLTAEEWCNLAKLIPQILDKSINNKGTTFSDYRDGLGKKGYHLIHLEAYGRAGEACNRCGRLLIKQKVAGRSTVYCPYCQK